MSCTGRHSRIYRSQWLDGQQLRVALMHRKQAPPIDHADRHAREEQEPRKREQHLVIVRIGRQQRDRGFLFLESRGPQQLLGAERRPTDRRIRSDERHSEVPVIVQQGLIQGCARLLPISELRVNVDRTYLAFTGSNVNTLPDAVARGWVAGSRWKASNSTKGSPGSSTST